VVGSLTVPLTYAVRVEADVSGQIFRRLASRADVSLCAADGTGALADRLFDDCTCDDGPVKRNSL
jgi:hypothetical protein